MKHSKQRILISFLIFSGTIGFLAAKTEKKLETLKSRTKAEWSFLVYMEADNNLNAFAIKNLGDMARVGSNEKLNILVQWNQPNQKGMWRYKVEKGRLILDGHLPAPKKNECVKNVVDSMRWVAQKYPAKQYALVLWNHGIGVIDPFWGQRINTLDVALPFNVTNLRKEISGITNNVFDRGILFNESTRTYMNNQQLTQALEQISGMIGKKIDVVGMDACLMGMVEIGYQIRKHANILVASQEVELAHGWFYSAFLAEAAVRKHISPFEFAHNIVLGYELFYKKKIPFYTQSALALEHFDVLRQNIDQVVGLIESCKRKHHSAMRDVIHRARKNCVCFNMPSYIDLHSFYSEMYTLLNQSSLKTTSTGQMYGSLQNQQPTIELINTVLPENYYQENITRETEDQQRNGELHDVRVALRPNKPNRPRLKPNYNIGIALPKPPLSQAAEVANLKEHLAFGMKLIEAIAFANVAGGRLSRARGISIYYPHNRIDTSYLKTDFAKDSRWIEFLRDNM